MTTRLACALLLLLAAPLARAQDPSRDYLTIATPHFRVSFTKPLESVARRVAANAERAYAQLSAELHPPRGTIEVLVTDDFDFSNGSATTSPTNRIIVYAMPPVNDFGLRYTTDWAQMVVTHELAHIFHLDRVRGVWRLGQYVFGRSPFLFPNAYQPSWLIEGLAVYEESRHAGQGRIEGPEHRLIVRAVAMDRGFPAIGEASLALPTFPQGSSAYVFGSMFMDYLARTRGDSAIRRYVESSSAQLVPYLIDIPARRAFGTSFSRAWSEWADSVQRPLFRSDVLGPPWKDLTGDLLVASSPRWVNDSTVSFTGTSGRETLAAYEVDTAGRRTRLGNRQGLSPTAVLPDGSLVFAQNEYIGPYQYRSDLYVQRRGESPRRLTHGQRLFAPDARGDGALLAMQVTEGATRIVRVARDGAVTPLTDASPDAVWAEPRWSHRGDRIVASRWLRGGLAQIVVLDTTGRVTSMPATGRAVIQSASWTPGDTAIFFTADGKGWRVLPDGSGLVARSLADEAVLEAEQRARFLYAAVALHGTGYRLGVGMLPGALGDSATLRVTTPDPRLPALAVDSSPARKYSALRQLLPRYWVPLGEQGYEGAYLLGGYTEGWDILRRHSWYVEAKVPTKNRGVVWHVEHQYRGLGRPVLTTAVNRDVTPFPVFDRGSPSRRVGTLYRRITDGELLSTFVRQLVRSTMALSLGAGLERREYIGDPAELLAAVDTGGIFRTADFPRVTASASYARYYSPAFSISPEDGFSFGVTARERLKSAVNASGRPSTSVVSALSLFKSIDLPGYSHHVVALRGTAGWTDTRSNSYFEVGGVSGGTFQLFPGYTIGEGRRSFPVRGFEPGVVRGIRAGAASLEYRAPLVLTHRGFSTLPTFLQRSALTLFGDYGIAWCPSTLATRQVCFDPSEEVKRDFASAGGELTVNAGLLSWDVPTRLRLGIAVPVHNGAPLGARSLTTYFATGISF